MFDEKPFRLLHIGERFEIFEHGLSIKLDDKTALDLLSGDIYPVNFNKKVSPASSLQFSQKHFLAQRQGQAVICRKDYNHFEVSSFLILKTDIIRDAAELQGIPYGNDDGIDIILKDIITNAETVTILAKALSLRRERQL